MKTLIAALFLLWTGPAFAAAPAKRMVVIFRPEVSAAERKAVLAQRGLGQFDDLAPLSASVVEIGGIGLNAVSLLEADPRVLKVEEDVYRRWINDAPESVGAVPMPSIDEMLASLPKIQDEEKIPWGIARVKAPQAWPTNKGAGVKVGVIDTGIAPHPDLKVAGGYNSSMFSSDYTDDNGHGTHVAGTIAARLNGLGVVGVAPEAELYAIKVLDKNGSGFMTDIVKGLIWAGRHHMDVVNMSLGAPQGVFLIHWALQYAHSQGVAVVAAAGNSGGDVEYPAGYSEAIAVAASDSSDHIADFSSRGPKVEFIAPGVAVYSTVPGGYDTYDGTSMATPHVTGLAALAVAKGHHGLEDVRAALKAAAVPLAGLAPTEQGAGIIDASRLK